MAEITKEKMFEVLYKKYEPMASKYANKLFGYGDGAIEFEDLLQEFRMKIYQAIVAYQKRVTRYKNGEAYKPVPLRQYLEAACSNLKTDLGKKINQTEQHMSIDDIDFDFGCHSETKINPEDNHFLLNGVDLLEGLKGRERAAFSLYLRGFGRNFISKVYCNNKGYKEMKKQILKTGGEIIDANKIIEMQINHLREHHGDSLHEQRKIHVTYSFDDE